MKKLVSRSLLSLSLCMVACSSSSTESPGSGTGDTGDGAKDAAGVCGAVKQPDVQVLLSKPINGTDFTGSTTYSCKWLYTGADGTSSNGMQLTFYVADGDKSNYDDLNDGTVQAQPISAIGDEAYWFQAVEGMATPTLVAHKGSSTCVVDAPADPADTTIKYTGSLNIDPSDAKDFVVKMGTLCTEIFAGNHD